jgi:hypothetical protein
VNDHLNEPKSCELLKIMHHDGITNEIMDKLRCKKKAYRDQSEADRWKDIYRVLFPGENAPSPCKSHDYHRHIILRYQPLDLRISVK